MRLLTERQMKRAVQAVTDHHLALIVELCGPSAIAMSEYERLRKSGIIKKLPTTPVDLVTAAHLLGQIISDADPKDAAKISAGTFWEMARHGSTITNIEHEAVELARDKIASLVSAQGARIIHQLNLAAHEVNDANHKAKLILGTAAEGIQSKKSAAQIAAKLKKALGDASKDWMRTAHTEVHNLVEEGKAIAIAKVQPNEDPLVYKLPRPDACPYCKLLYLKDGVPRVFRLSVLVNNGSNIGRKPGRPSFKGKGATEYKATLGAVHPWCKCELHYMPKNAAFNGKGEIVFQKSEVDITDSLDELDDLFNHECVDA